MNNPPRTATCCGQANEQEADARSSIRAWTWGLLLLWAGAGCIVIPLPLNRADPATRENVRSDTGQALAVGEITREQVLLKLGEPDVIAAGERQFRYHTERVKWDIFWAAGGYGSAAAGDLEVKKHSDLVLDFDDSGKLRACAWEAGYNPKKLQARQRWATTNAPVANPSEELIPRACDR